MVMGLVVGNTTAVWGQLEKYFKMSCAELEKKGNAGDVNAQHVLGMKYQLGEDGWEKDVVKAFKWFEKAAKQGDLHSQSYIGYAYSSGIGVEKNINKAIEWYSKAAERGDASAQRSLGDIYLQADDVPQDCLKAIEWYKKAANNLSDSLSANMAAFDLGSCYEWGKCVTKDISEAKIWYKISADLGNSYSKQHLEELEDPKLKKKNEEEKNKREIEELTQKANNGDDNAQCDLAFYYSNGEKGLKKNYKKSNEWYEKAAKQGNCRAQRSLGVAYYEGLGVKQDYTKAFEWYEKAAKQGDLLAYQFLGTCYLEGKGVASDCKKAIELYEKYMEQKEDYFIAYKLGEIYRYGANGCIPINLVEAKKWFNKSANLGWDMANVQIEDIEDIESGKKEMYIPNPTENNGSYTENRGKNPKVKKQRDGHGWETFGKVLEGLSAGLDAATEYVSTYNQSGYNSGYSGSSAAGYSGSTTAAGYNTGNGPRATIPSNYDRTFNVGNQVWYEKDNQDGTHTTWIVNPCYNCKGTNICSICNGSGQIALTSMTLQCAACKGTGHCSNCNAQGQMISMTVSDASGNGYITDNNGNMNSLAKIKAIEESRKEERGKGNLDELDENIKKLDQEIKKLDRIELLCERYLKHYQTCDDLLLNMYQNPEVYYSKERREELQQSMRRIRNDNDAKGCPVPISASRWEDWDGSIPWNR